MNQITLKKKKDFQGLSFPNKVLPILKVRYNSDNNNNLNLEEKKLDNLKENKNYIIINNNSKSIELNPPTLLNDKINKKKDTNEENIFLKNRKKNYFERANRFRAFNKFNTLKMIVDKNRPFNYRGQIDIIVEE